MQNDPTSFTSIAEASSNMISAQWWVLFAVCVANKPAAPTTKKVHALLSELPEQSTPFEQVAAAIQEGTLRKHLEHQRVGQYRRIEGAFKGLMEATKTFGDDPRQWRLETLESIHGIGPKTARWFYLLVNPKAKVAALDTHVLKFLRDQRTEKVPKSTPPSGYNYNRLEAAFISHAERLGIPPRDLDYFVWAVYRNKGRVLFAQ